MKKLSLLFIPRAENNHRALLLHPSFLALFIAVYLLNQSILKTITLVKPGILGYSSEITVQKILTQTNLERQKNNLPPLQYSSALSLSAQAKAEDMFQKDYWAHTSPDGLSPWHFFQQADYKYSVAGENLAKDFYDTSSMVSAWMKSTTHRDNILHSKYQQTGIAVVNGILGGVKTTLVVQHFATPLATDTVFSQSQPQPPVAVQFQTQVLAETAPKTISPVLISKIIGIVLFTLIIAVLVIDGYHTLKNNTHRLTGSTTGHIGFLAIILLLLIFTRQGSIF